MYKLPQKIIWNQNNRSDRLGDLWASQNLDLTSNYGALRVSPRMILNASSATLTNMDAPMCAVQSFQSSGSDDVGASTMFIWAMAGARVYNSRGGLNTVFKQDATSSTPTTGNSDQSDMKLLGVNMFFTGASTTVKYLNGTWNSATGTLGNSSGLHQMTFFRGLNRLYIVDDNSTGISTISGTTITAATASTQYTLKSLVDGTSVKISWIASTSSRVWIGTINLLGQGKVYAWDGNTGSGGTYNPNEVYTLEANGSLACVIKDDAPCILDTRGRLLQLNGGTFTELDRLPFGNNIPLTFDANPTGRLCHYNGMSLDNGNINILVNTQLWDTNSTNKENVPSGVWEYTKETGLYHKRSVGQSLVAGTIVDYGQQKLDLVGALHEIEAPASAVTQGSTNGRMVAGVAYYTNATATLNGIFYDDTNDTLQKAGGFTTAKIFSSNITEIWQKMYLRFKKLLTATDKMVVKYRTVEEDSSEFTITWTSSTTFTTTTNIVGKEKYEIEVLQGTGAGKCSHLTATSYNAVTYEGTVDETYTGATGTAKVRMQNWKKMGVVDSQNVDFKPFSILSESTSSWIQFKCWILSTGKNEVNDLTIINAPHQPPK